jgi:1-deoxy-D-xylulose-5-phosphate reductoisomerase
MMNKGLEIIEARWLFNVAPSAIDVLVHPESIVHSIVEYNDLTQIAELSIPDMTFAINYALTWPKRAPHNLHKPLDLATLGTLHFSSPDEKRFPCLALAKESLVRGGTAPAILNAANEIAVEAFLQKRIRFSDIWCIVEKTLDTIKPTSATDLDSIFDADLQARKLSAEICSR